MSKILIQDIDAKTIDWVVSYGSVQKFLRKFFDLGFLQLPVCVGKGKKKLPHNDRAAYWNNKM
jgi:hypothetical protein